MPTIDWKPIDLTDLVPGFRLGNSPIDLIERLAEQERWVHNFYHPPVMTAAFTNNTPATSASTTGAFTTANSGSPTTLTRFMVRENAARHPLTVKAFALVSNNGTTGTLTLTHGGASSTATVTATSATAVTLTVTPTTGSSPLEAVITGHTDDSNAIVLVSMVAHLEPADRTDGGAGADGYAPTYDVAANNGISTEYVSRAYNNIRALARDRVACLTSIAHPANDEQSRAAALTWHNLTTTSALLGRLYVLPCENATRGGVVSAYFHVGAGVSGKVQILVLGGDQTIHDVSASGWIHQDIEIPATGATVLIQSVLDATASASTGGVGLWTAQVFRKP